jgi:hypothetical protein
MNSIDDVRRIALSLPGTSEGTHFRMPSFEVGDKHFAVVQKGKNRVLFYLDETDARAAIARDPDAVEESRRRDRFEGIWVDLDAISTKRLEQLAKLAWRAKAPAD